MSHKTNVIDQEVTRIYNRDGYVTASTLLEESKRPNAPLHHHFEWDDSVAANEHRLWQARQLIARARIIVLDQKEEFVNVPRVANEGEGKEGYYKPISVVVKDVDEFTLAWDAAQKRLEAARKELHELERVAGKTSGKKKDTLARVKLALKAVDSACVALAG